MSSLTFDQRQILAERLYVMYAYTHQTLDFTQWITQDVSSFFLMIDEGIKRSFAYAETDKNRDVFDLSDPPRYNKEGKGISDKYDDVMPAYCTGFKSYLGYILSTAKPSEIGKILDNKLAKADLIDCEYLTEILAEIRFDISKGYGFDPGQKQGVDRYIPADSSIEFNLQSAERWLLKAEKKAAEQDKFASKAVVHNSPPKIMSENLQRPNSIRQRIQGAEKVYEEARAHFKSKDYIDWSEDVKSSNGEIVHLSYDDFIKPYCSRYPTMLGFIFSCIDNLDVAPVLDKHFPAFDKIDADYLDDALSKIQDIVGAYSFSTTSNDGIDYYNGYKNENEMFHASMEGQDTDNRFAPKVISNVARARKWAATNPIIPVTVSIITDNPTNQSEVIEPAVTSRPPEQTHKNAEPVALEWLGNGADLAELFYRLAKAGFINLNQFRPPNGGNMTSLCKHICQLFQVGQTPEKNNAAAVALQKALAKFGAEELKAGEVDAVALARKPIERKPGNSMSARIARAIPNKDGVG